MSQVYTITHPNNESIFIHAMAGHFISANSHLNWYVGTSDIKHNHNVATEAAKELAKYYTNNDINIDTVLCLYETQSLGAFLAHELASPTMMSPNPDASIYVIGSEYDAIGNLIFRDNLRKRITGKNVLILISCITSGKTVQRAMESVGYYGGKVAGISAAFSLPKEIDGMYVNTLFSGDEIPGYTSYPAHDCPLCQKGLQVDAISNGYGYSKL